MELPTKYILDAGYTIKLSKVESGYLCVLLLNDEIKGQALHSNLDFAIRNALIDRMFNNEIVLPTGN